MIEHCDSIIHGANLKFIDTIGYLLIRPKPVASPSRTRGEWIPLSTVAHQLPGIHMVFRSYSVDPIQFDDGLITMTFHGIPHGTACHFIQGRQILAVFQNHLDTRR
jgi:hypothetical protein